MFDKRGTAEVGYQDRVVATNTYPRVVILEEEKQKSLLRFKRNRLFFRCRGRSRTSTRQL